MVFDARPTIEGGAFSATATSIEASCVPFRNVTTSPRAPRGLTSFGSTAAAIASSGTARWRTKDRDPSGTPSPWRSKGLRPPFHRTRTVAWAAWRAHLRKDGIGWTGSLSESTSPRTSWMLGVRPSGERFVVARTEAGRKELNNRLGQLGAAVVGLEATGGYETFVAASLSAAGLPVVVINPAQVRRPRFGLRQRVGRAGQDGPDRRRRRSPRFVRCRRRRRAS